MNQKQKRCSCGRGRHGKIHHSCDFYFYSQLGHPPFQVLELNSRLRLYNEQIQYPSCYYESNQVEEVEMYDVSSTNDTSTVNSNTIDVDSLESEGTNEDDDSLQSECFDDDCRISHRVFELMHAEEDDYTTGYDSNEDSDSDKNQSIEPTADEIRMGTNIEFNQILEKIIQDADRLSQIDKMNVTMDSDDDIDLLNVEEITTVSKHKTVPGDLFHFMDRAKLPMHHEYKALFFRSLRAAIFVMNTSDVEEVKEVLESKQGQSWEFKMAFEFEYIAKRVRRRVPPPQILYNRMKAVFDFLKNKIDTQTGVALFHEKNKRKFMNMLELVKKGYGSDPPKISMYIPKTDRFGKPIVDRDGLTLYRSIRGTSNLESLHQYLTTSFGHTIAGPWYSDILLTIVRHFYNWRMSMKNRPNFSNLTHYNGLLIDRINNLYELIYGHTKNRDWSTYNENLPSQLTFGIVPVNIISIVKLFSRLCPTVRRSIY